MARRRQFTVTRTFCKPGDKGYRDPEYVLERALGPFLRLCEELGIDLTQAEATRPAGDEPDSERLSA